MPRPSRVDCRIIPLAAALLLALGGRSAVGQAPSPPPPAKYRVWLRYQLRVTPVERPGHFFQLLDALEALGFKKDAGSENEEADPLADRMTGTIVSANARKLLRDRRVQALVLAPADFKLPEDADAPVKVRLELLPGLPPTGQRLLSDQVRPLLAAVGFREAIGYDHRGHTRLVGTVPAGRLDLLLQDLRWQTTGWLVPETPVARLDLPLRMSWPVVVTEVTPEPADAPPAGEAPGSAAPPPEEAYRLKITPELRAIATPEGEAARPLRMEVLLAATPSEDVLGWDRDLTLLAPGIRVEGRLGQVVTVLGRPEHAAQLAQSPTVSTVRLPRVARVPLAGSVGDRTVNRDLLLESGLERLHNLGHRGRGVRVVVLDSDFRGYAFLVGKQLPSSTRLFDLTAERNLDLVPDPFPGDPALVGTGTQAALAVALAAPEAEITLVRVDSAAPYMVQEAARNMAGPVGPSLSLAQRSQELRDDTELVGLRWDQINAERRVILETFGQDERSVKRRLEFFQREEQLRKHEAALDERRVRYLNLRRDLQALRGTHVVVSNLVWDTGYAADGSSALTRYFDSEPARPVWFHSAGGARGQVWAGAFRDADGNGVLEFAPPDVPLRARRWTPELNFLGWQDRGGRPGEEKAELPAQARVRISVQWREPHDPSFWQRGEDLFRVPLANPRLLVLRQRDPTGTKLPADALELVARGTDLPQRIDNQPTYATYEQTVEFTPEAGVFALRIEGHQPTDIRPPGVPTLEANRVTWELRPRVVVEVLDEASAGKGRPVFLDYRTDEGTLGMPADAHSLVTVGAASESGRPVSAGARGPVLGILLLPKPDVFAYDGWHLDFAGGKPADRVGVAAPFAAGLAASVLSSGAPPGVLVQALGAQQGTTIRVPER